MKLFYRQSGEGRPLVILHGLFGSSDNWFTLAKVFSEKFTVYLIDQRNHGQSPHSDEFNYELLTDDLLEFIEEHKLQKPDLIGHSMGGKTVMNFAVRYPEKCGKLIVVDIVPKAYPVYHDHILEGLLAVKDSNPSSRNAADATLTGFVPQPAVRQFLLKNLARNKEGKLEWKINVKGIGDNIESISEGMVFPGVFDGESLFVKGAQSDYYAAGDEDLIRKIFTNATFTTLNTGHWVQADDPQAFSSLVLNYLS